MAITADNLNSWVEFDSAFTVRADGSVTDSNEYAPRVEHSDDSDIAIDSDGWVAFSGGYTGQDRYSGPVMHASETLSGALAADILATPGTYAVVAVESPCTPAAPCFPEEPNYCVEHGCDAPPAGWIVVRKSEGGE